MPNTNPIPANMLTASHLKTHPVWQFCGDAESDADYDESYVKPCEEALALGAFGSYLVAANYQLANGDVLPGAVQLDLLGAKVHFTPSTIYVKEKSIDPLAHDASVRLTRITKTSNTQPVQWTLAVHFDGEQNLRSGKIAKTRWVTALSLLVRLVVLRFSRRR
ncbi:hypothetical protein H8K33_13540 [Undibacterium amnicola]|uniref:Uncharacterized protein n=1 Tax=Undibacterium amnicola TaxID=1834038 RepID=A0ABR6XSS3_9BURK|nr:hypothetical protein [Undibacterium amnicola]MBC3832525.1 hypothetical protein [Undibacterium amnicola]